jgi:hypothetical protein
VPRVLSGAEAFSGGFDLASRLLGLRRLLGLLSRLLGRESRLLGLSRRLGVSAGFALPLKSRFSVSDVRAVFAVAARPLLGARVPLLADRGGVLPFVPDPRDEAPLGVAEADPLRVSGLRAGGDSGGEASAGTCLGVSFNRVVRGERSCAAVVDSGRRAGGSTGLRVCAAPLPLLPGGTSREFTASTPRRRLPPGTPRPPVRGSRPNTLPNPCSLFANLPPKSDVRRFGPPYG